MPQCLIGDFRIQRPTHSGEHQASVKWLAAAHAKSEAIIRSRATLRSDSPLSDETFDVEIFQRSMERYIARFGCKPNSLATRGFDLEDFLHTEWNRMRVFNLDAHPRGANMDTRMEVFAENSGRVLENFYPEGSEPPSEMIHVSCTGYVAPSAAQKLIVKRGWEQRTGIVHAYHMGCYASLPALRMASAFLASPRILVNALVKQPDVQQNRIDIVHTEACSLHLDPSQHTPEQLVVQSLFADGHIRYSLSHSDQGPGLLFLGVHEELIPGSLGAMGWILGERGMRMLLAREVPELIASALIDFLKRMFARANIDPYEAFTTGLFAIHPGGPRIIDKVATLLELQPHQVSASRAVLKAHGNMSSATLPHIWAAIVIDPTIPSGTLVTSLAFGPGLTVYGAMLRKA